MQGNRKEYIAGIPSQSWARNDECMASRRVSGIPPNFNQTPHIPTLNIMEVHVSHTWFGDDCRYLEIEAYSQSGQKTSSYACNGQDISVILSVAG